VAHGPTRKLTTGVATMDAEHWELLTVLAQVRAAVDEQAAPAAVSALLLRLREEASAHFAAEERLMRAHGYPMATSHQAQHARFLDDLDRRVWAPGLVEADVARLETWFARHIELADQPLADWVLRCTG